MIWGLSGEEVNPQLLYAGYINRAATLYDFPPKLAYAIAWRETISGETNGLWNAQTVVSADGGHGLFQLTSSWPDDWRDPYSNARYAITQFLAPAVHYWHGLQGFSGDDLVKLTAATFNAGLTNVIKGHNEGNADIYTTNAYGAGVLVIYQSLVASGVPQVS